MMYVAMHRFHCTPDGLLTLPSIFPTRRHRDGFTLGIGGGESNARTNQPDRSSAFRAAIAAGADAVMVAHITAPVLEPDPSRVATNSPAIVTGLLKQQLGFTGLVITDANGYGRANQRVS